MNSALSFMFFCCCFNEKTIGVVLVVADSHDGHRRHRHRCIAHWFWVVACVCLIVLLLALQSVGDVAKRALDVADEPAVFGRVAGRNGGAARTARRVLHLLGLRFEFGNQLAEVEAAVRGDAVGVRGAQQVQAVEQLHPLRLRLRQAGALLHLAAKVNNLLLIAAGAAVADAVADAAVALYGVSNSNGRRFVGGRGQRIARGSLRLIGRLRRRWLTAGVDAD